MRQRSLVYCINVLILIAVIFDPTCGSDTKTAISKINEKNKYKCKWPHVTNIFYEEYLEYENITTLCVKEFEE